MARACILNYNDRGKLLLEKLRVEGKIKKFWNVVGTPKWCFEFDNELEIRFTDYVEVSPSYMLNKQITRNYLIEEFKKAIILEIMKTLKGAVVEDVDTSSYIVLKPTEKTKIVCIRLTKKEKEELERKAVKEGLTLSEYIRKKLFS